MRRPRALSGGNPPPLRSIASPQARRAGQRRTRSRWTTFPRTRGDSPLGGREMLESIDALSAAQERRGPCASPSRVTSPVGHLGIRAEGPLGTPGRSVRRASCHHERGAQVGATAARGSGRSRPSSRRQLCDGRPGTGRSRRRTPWRPRWAHGPSGRRGQPCMARSAHAPASGHPDRARRSQDRPGRGKAMRRITQAICQLANQFGSARGVQAYGTEQSPRNESPRKTMDLCRDADQGSYLRKPQGGRLRALDVRPL